MKKHLINSSILLAFLFSFINGGYSENPNVDNPPDYLPLELVGSLDYGTGTNNVESYYSSNAIYILFHQDYGYVSITLYNGSGLSIYTDVVNTTVQQTVIIPITGAPSGDYILVLENANGYAEGEFNKEP